MFNLLMSSDVATWDRPIGHPHSSVFPLSRFLEYTSTDIEARFKPLSADVIGKVADFEAVFMSEVQYNADGPEVVAVRIGRIFNVRIESGDIHYDFIIDESFGMLPLVDRKQFEGAFGLGRMEVYRTHWALKNGSLEDAIRSVGLVRTFRGPNVPLSPPPPPPPPPMIPVPDIALPEPVVVENLQQYLEFILGLAVGEGDDVFYRGHPSKYYRLEPSLFRKTPAGEYRYLQNESKMVSEILTTQSASFASDQYMLDRLVRMQHFGLPTRLLDISYNPLVALYFCCAEIVKDHEGNEVDGQVIVLNTDRHEVKFFDSDLLSCIANLSILDEASKEQLDCNLPWQAFNGLPACQKLIHFVCREKPYFESRINSRDLEKIVFARGRNTHERMTSQSGAFLIFGKDAVLPETGHSTLHIRRVTVRNKVKILEQLSKVNIKSSTIYPGLEKSTAELARKYDVH
ncbi:FRG domain-containing protein [Aureimonas glaciei]|uniref:FRG domain-containing protein n=1 Tax=Aureimonas glaciei TaxID=1776957 RepID=UPI00166D1955|nr:FRG domain-containing protein [Aureimonas glaciei]